MCRELSIQSSTPISDFSFDFEGLTVNLFLSDHSNPTPSADI